MDLRGMPAQLVAAMAAAVEGEPRTILLNRAADLASVPWEERPIPMSEDGADTTSPPEDRDG